MADNKAILEQANAAITRGDHEGFLVHCAEDTVWTFVGEQPLEGKAAVREWMARTYVEPPRFDVEDLVAEGDLVVAIGSITLPDEAGVPTRNEYCDVWRFRDGLIVGLRAFVVASDDA